MKNHGLNGSNYKNSFSHRSGFQKIKDLTSWWGLKDRSSPLLTRASCSVEGVFESVLCMKETDTERWQGRNVEKGRKKQKKILLGQAFWETPVILLLWMWKQKNQGVSLWLAWAMWDPDQILKIKQNKSNKQDHKKMSILFFKKKESIFASRIEISLYKFL